MTGNGIQTEGFVEQRKELEQLLMTNPSMEKAVQDIMRKVLAAARRKMTAAARQAMDTDPKQAYKAVRTMVYRQILGGNINILNKKKASGGGGAGGSRRGRTKHTEQIMGYMGSDRGFILRFVNAGTKDRVATHMNGHMIRRKDIDERDPKTQYRSGAIGFRGAIRARNWFANSSQAAMEEAAGQFATMIDQLIKEKLGNG